MMAAKKKERERTVSRDGGGELNIIIGTYTLWLEIMTVNTPKSALTELAFL